MEPSPADKRDLIRGLLFDYQGIRVFLGLGSAFFTPLTAPTSNESEISDLHSKCITGKCNPSKHLSRRNFVDDGGKDTEKGRRAFDRSAGAVRGGRALI